MNQTTIDASPCVPYGRVDSVPRKGTRTKAWGFNPRDHPPPLKRPEGPPERASILCDYAPQKTKPVPGIKTL
jgi:hypothetical protein